MSRHRIELELFEPVRSSQAPREPREQGVRPWQKECEAGAQSILIQYTQKRIRLAKLDCALAGLESTSQLQSWTNSKIKRMFFFKCVPFFSKHP